ARRPASRIALRIASTAIARVVRPEPREYSVSPTPTMQYLSLSVFIATGGLLWLGSDEAAERTEVEIEIFGSRADPPADVADRLLESHECLAHVLGLRGGERTGIHAADRLTLHQLTQELDQRENEPRDRALHVLRIGVPARRRQIADAPLQLGAQRFQLADAQRRLEAALSGLAQPSASGANAYGDQGPVATTRSGASATLSIAAW